MDTANAVNMDIFIPAFIFSVLSAENFALTQYTHLALGGLIVVLGSGLILWPLCRWLKFNPKTFLPPMMYNNSGNLGLPLALLAFGEAALPAAVVLFLVENTLHFTVGIYSLNRSANPVQILKMPIVIATIVGLLWSTMSWTSHPAIRTVVDMLGQISIPLMLFTLGIRMTDVTLTHWRISALGALLCPLSGLVVALGFIFLLPLPQEQQGYLLLFSVLPPAVLNYMVAERFKQQPEQVAAIVLIGNMSSLLIIPVALWFIL